MNTPMPRTLNLLRASKATMIAGLLLCFIGARPDAHAQELDWPVSASGNEQRRLSPGGTISARGWAAGASAPEEEEEERREQQRRGGGQLQHGGRRLGEQRLRVRERAAHE